MVLSLWNKNWLRETKLALEPEPILIYYRKRQVPLLIVWLAVRKKGLLNVFLLCEVFL